MSSNPPAKTAPQDRDIPLIQAQKLAKSMGQWAGKSAALMRIQLKLPEELAAGYLTSNNNTARSEAENLSIAQAYASAYTMAYERNNTSMHPGALPAAPSTSTASLPEGISTPLNTSSLLEKAKKLAATRGPSAGYKAALYRKPPKSPEKLEAHYLNKFKDSALSEEDNLTLAQFYAKIYKTAYEKKATSMAASLPTSTSTSTSAQKRPASVLSPQEVSPAKRPRTEEG